MLRLLTSGESHGRYLSAILEGFPSEVSVSLEAINAQLERRQQGYGRGGRQKIETDRVSLSGGVLQGKTTGAPIGFLLENRDAKINEMPELERPRPGHADLVGSLKYHQGIRAVLERASARETAMRVAAGALCRELLKIFGIDVLSHVIQVGTVKIKDADALGTAEIPRMKEGSQMNCVSRDAEKEMMALVDEARRRKDSLGGRFEVRVSGVPIGLGSHVHWERKLDGLLAQSLMSMQSVKAVEIGLGTEAAARFGSEAHDEIFFDKHRGYYRKTNRAGGIEGGTSNGSDLVIRVTMKPISTLGQPLASVNMKTKQAEKADFERSDICAVPAGSVIGEAIAAYVTAEAFLEKFGGDSLTEIKRNYEGYLEQLRRS